MSNNPNDIISRRVNCNNCIRIQKENTDLQRRLAKDGEELFSELIMTVFCQNCEDMVDADATKEGKITCGYCSHVLGTLKMYDEDEY